MTVQIPSTSVEYLHIPVTGDYTTSMPVFIAVVTADSEPVSADWKTAAWDGTDAKILIGAGTTLVLAEGLYGAWVKITATPEVPVIFAGAVRIT